MHDEPKGLAAWALDTASLRGAQYAEVRIVDDRLRKMSTKNARVAESSMPESLGIGIRILVNRAWGFSATSDLSRESVERTAMTGMHLTTTKI